MHKLLRLILDNLDTALIVALSITAAIFGVFGGRQEIVLSAIAGAIGLVAYSVFRDREARNDLAKQVEEISDSLKIIRERISADDFFQTESSESEMIKRAQESIWIVQETGSKIVEDNFKSLERIANAGGDIRIILASADEYILRLISFRNRNLQLTDLKARHDSAIRKLLSLSQAINKEKSLRVRVIQYPLDATCVLVDTESSDYSRREGLVRLTGFRDFFADKRDFSINHNRETTTFQYFISQFEKMWEASEEIVLNIDLEIPTVRGSTNAGSS
jgi:hypothetical protein